MLTPGKSSDPTDALGAWDIGGFSLELYGGGMSSTTWRVVSDAGVFVAKTGDATPQLERGLAATAEVAAAGVPAGAPVATRDGALTVPYGEGRLCLLEFVPGRPIDDTKRSEARAWGTTLARVHRALAGRSDLADGMPCLPLIDLDAPHLDLEPWIRPAITPVVRAVQSYRGTFGVLHGDPAVESFLFNDDTGRVGIIDFGASWWGPLVYDLASLRMYANPAMFDVALTGYADAAPLPEAELSALDLFLRFRWCVQADYFSWRIANSVLTGLADATENLVGLNDARDALLSS